MRLWISVLTLLISVSSYAEEACLNDIKNAQQFGAEYTRSSSKSDELDNWTYWRREAQVAYYYPQSGISDIWSLGSKNKVDFLRQFDRFEKGIAYGAADLKMLGKGANWNNVRDIMQLPQGINKASVGDYRCLKISVYKLPMEEGSLYTDIFKHR